MEEKNTYTKYLQLIGSLSRLFSESSKPFLYYRIAEHLYIKSFRADDVTRSDIAIDAINNGVGVGLKTFQGNNGGTSFQKIAEFNKLRNDLEETRKLKGDASFIEHISTLRNERIQFVSDTFAVNQFIYHCVVRDVGKFSIHEEKMEKINIESIKIIASTSSTIKFTDGLHTYSFNFSKSTLLKKFDESRPLYIFDIKILDDPLDILLSKLDSINVEKSAKIESIILPLYSTKTTVYGTVPERSGLNQWNADGRLRDLKEVYIPIPARVRKAFPSFLPKRGTQFELILPDKSVIPVAVAQDDGKALMSNPNTLLGEWLITKALRIKPGEIVTRNILDRKGFDAVELSNINGKFYLNLKETGSYEDFIKSLK